MNTAELIKKVRRIEIKTKGLSQQIFGGEYQSAFKGRGMSFSEVRDYRYGDDIRNIDWNVTARTGDPHVKTFEEERELTVMLLVDISRSNFFGSVHQFKNEIVTEICAVLAFSATTNNDKVGLLLFSDRIEKFIPPKKGRSHILRIIRELLETEPEGRGTDLAAALDYFNNMVKKRSICFLMSDFLTGGYQRALAVAARRHDLIGVHLYDPRERELPDVGLMYAHDAESGLDQWLDTSSKRIRTAYTEQYDGHQEYFREAFRRGRADVVSIATTEDYVRALRRFFASRTA